MTASPSLRAAPSCKHAVMFTGFISESDSALVRDLGGVLTEELAECTVLVADSMKRTVKLLCMVGIITPSLSLSMTFVYKIAILGGQRSACCWRVLVG